jgi:hypothetical protein
MDFIFGILRSTWLKALVYVIVGIGVNTTPPHYPTFSGNFGAGVELHSLVQYVISIMLWPLSFWHPEFTVGKWTGL